MARDPTVIIVHGAYHQPEHFNTVAAHLRDAGLEVVLPRLPSVGLTADPGGALHLDAAIIRDTLKEVIVDEGNDALLMMHSYGGLAGTEGFGMFQEEGYRTEGSPSAKVKRLVYLVAHGAVEKGHVHIPADVNPPHLVFDVCSLLRPYESVLTAFVGQRHHDPCPFIRTIL